MRIRSAFRRMGATVILLVLLGLTALLVGFELPSSPVVFAAGFPPDASAAIQSAQHQFNSGNYAAAIKTLQGAASQNPNSAEVQYWLGRSYYEFRDYDNEITASEKSVSRSNNSQRSSSKLRLPIASSSSSRMPVLMWLVVAFHPSW